MKASRCQKAITGIERSGCLSFKSQFYVNKGPLFQSWSSLGIQIEGCLFTYVGRELCLACKLEGQDFHGATYKQPFSESFPKLEVSGVCWNRFNLTCVAQKVSKRPTHLKTQHLVCSAHCSGSEWTSVDARLNATKRLQFQAFWRVTSAGSFYIIYFMYFS